MKTVNKNDLLNFIIDFATDNDFNDESIPHQIRAFFTTWCFAFDIEADTDACDDALATIFYRAGLEGAMDYERFENFMLELIAIFYRTGLEGSMNYERFENFMLELIV